MKVFQTIITLGLILFLTACNKQSILIYNNDLGTSESIPQVDSDYFLHGVASGDPMKDRVIIWTRISNRTGGVQVQWEVSHDTGFNTIVKKGKITTNSSRDYTVKVDVGGLDAGSRYFFRFIYKKYVSPIGRTQTLPKSNPDAINLGIVSCSNYEFGYFNAYEGLADEDLDAILHLGDYIYEYAPNKYGDKDFERKHLPAKELITLDDYRIRYAQYRTDRSLQRAHQMHPFIMIWDDHEIANNTYENGAQNHQDDEGNFLDRKLAAKQAYYEWQPIRESSNSVLYRSFEFGDMLDLIMLDERYIGRNEPPKVTEDAKDKRSMLGQEQLLWFKTQLSNSQAQWKVVGNQVIFAPIDLSLVRPENPINLDAWDGYDYERNQIIEFLTQSSINNTIFVTGDTHSSWGIEVPINVAGYKNDGRSCAIEIGTPSITSANWDEGSSTEKTILGEQALQLSNSHLKYVNGRDHGYTILRLSKSKAVAQWYYTDNIKEKTSEIRLAKALTIGKNQKFIDQ